MKKRTYALMLFVLLALAVPATQALAQSTYTPYAFANFAGLPSIGSADGVGSAARFYAPAGVAVDNAGNIYVADKYNHTVRKITPDAMVTTLAGNPRQAGSTDGTGGAARFNYPSGVAVDTAGNLYVSDSGNNTIRKITAAGEVTTLAGAAGSSGSIDGTGSSARFNYPWGVAVDGPGNLYVADAVSSTIRKISPTGVVMTLAGLAGHNGSTDGTGSAARFDRPSGVAVDSIGNVYVGDYYNYTIRRITPDGVVTTLAGSPGNMGNADGFGTTARFYGPAGIAADGGGNVYVTDAVTIRKITPAAEVTTLAGSAFHFGSADGTGSSARFYSLVGVALDSAGNLYAADAGNNAIRKISPTAAVTTLAGVAGYGSTDGTGGLGRFDHPTGVAADPAGNVYAADSNNRTIRKLTPAALITTLAGSAGQSGTNDGTGSAARFYAPAGLAVDAVGTVYVTDDHAIRRISPDAMVRTLAGSPGRGGSADGVGSSARFLHPSGVAADDGGNLYVADTQNHTIRKITPAGVVATLAGTAQIYGSADATGADAQFFYPSGVAVGRAGDVFVADTYNHTIRKITPAGVVTTLAGTPGLHGRDDAVGSAARFNYPWNVAVDTVGNVYVADSGNHSIRRITPAGVVTTLGGSAEQIGTADGNGAAARFYEPQGVTLDAAGNLYVADTYNSRITKGTALLQFDTSAGGLSVANGAFHARLIGPSGSDVVISPSVRMNAA